MADQKSNTPEKDARTDGQPKIIWDDSTMNSSYCNVSNVAGGREEIILLFGMNQAWHSGQKEVTVKLSDRMVMSPFAAKRLSLLLNNALAGYEKRFGKLEIGVPQASVVSDSIN